MKTIFAAAAAAFLLAAPAFAAEEYPSGSPLVLGDQVPSLDTGSAQTPRFDGQDVVVLPRERVLQGSGAESSVDTVNSQSVPLGTWHNSIGLALEP